MRLTATFGGTEILNILQHRYLHEEGFVIAGTSAGAMAMSNTMIYQGSSSGALIKGEVKITTGLALMGDVIIDSHFDKRGRFGRLAQAVASNPSCIGIGLGEDTGVLCLVFFQNVCLYRSANRTYGLCFNGGVNICR